MALGEVLAFDLGDGTVLGGSRMLYLVSFGSANAGGVPVFTQFKRLDTGDDLEQPAISEFGSKGQYTFPYDWSTSLATSIAFQITLNGIELDGVISSPNVAIPGTSVAEGGTSSLVGYEQVGAIVARTAVEVGIAAFTPDQIAAFDPFAQSDAHILQMLRLLDGLGRHLCTVIPREREFTVNVVDGTLSYGVPADYVAMVDGTLWNRPATLPAFGPVTAQTEAALKARTTSATVGAAFRVKGNLLTFPVQPAAGTYYGTYLSRYWVQTAASGTGPDADHVTAATDYVLLDPELVVLGLKLKFAQARGFDTAAALYEYRQRLEFVKGANHGAPTLSLSGSGGLGFIDSTNLPVTGWGL